MKPLTVIYSEGTKTIRQMPQNYLIAYNREGRWVCDSDTAADVEICKVVFEVLLTHTARYSSGEELLDMIKRKMNVEEELTEEQLICFGRNVADLLHAKRYEEGIDRWKTDFGSKTDLGLGRTIIRLLEDVKG